MCLSSIFRTVFITVLSISLLYTCTLPERDYDTIYLSLQNDPRGLDPAFSTDYGTGQICALIFDNLVQFDSVASIQPGVAKSWSVSDDGLVYQFRLHDNFRFTTGALLTASDVKRSFERVIDPEINSPQSWIFDPVEGTQEFISGINDHVTGIEAVSSTELQITLTRPFAPFLSFLAMPAAAIVPENVLGQNEYNMRESPVGSGPWILTDWSRDHVIVLKANRDYFYGPPEEKHLQIKILPEVFSNIAEFETGRLDVIELPQSEFSRWINSRDSEIHIFRKPELNFYYIGMNCSRPPFDDRRVRRAMNYAVDMKSVITNMLNSAAKLSHGPIPPGLAAYDSTRDAYGYDPERAKELLKSAGYDKGFVVDLWQSQTSEYSELGEAFQAYFEDIGVRVNIKRTDFNLLQDAIRQGQPDMYYLNWWADYPDAENFLYPLFYSGQARNRNRYSNTRVDSLIIANQTSTSKKERIKLAQLAEKEIYRDAPYVFLFHEITYEIAQSWVDGYQPAVMFNGQRYRKVKIENGYK